MGSDIKSQLLERYRLAQEYSDKGIFEVKYSIADKEVKASGKFATKYVRDANVLKMKWSKVTKVFSAGKALDTKFLGNEIFELKLGDGANLLHKGTEPKRLVATGRSYEMDMNSSSESLLLVRIVPPLLMRDLFIDSKINFNYETEFDVEEGEEFYTLISKNSPVKVSVQAGKNLVIKEVSLQIGEWTKFFNEGPLAFAKKYFDPMVNLIEKKVPSTLIGTYKYDPVSIKD